VGLVHRPTPVDALDRLRAALGPGCPRLVMKRDDLLSFAMGGNKVRKMDVIAAEAVAGGADTLITCGGVQSNHARVTAAVGSALGLEVHLVVNAPATVDPTGNLRLNQLFGADVHVVSSRDERAGAMADLAARLEQAGRRPFVVPLGGSTPTGALGLARLAVELILPDVPRPDVIVHASSSGGTQAGLIAGCAIVGLGARVLGVSADEPAATLRKLVTEIVEGTARVLGASPSTVGATTTPELDDTFVGEGYGIPTPASIEAQTLVARHEGIVLDPVYTAKAMACLIARVRSGEFRRDDTVLFLHTGGVPGFFA
jgi:D-cysteine desulfhydrase family pyridoxal phosphate-dependent enzyme